MLKSSSISMFRLSAFGSTAVYSTEHDGLRCVEVCPTSMLVFCGLGECAGMHPKYLVHISQNKLNSFLKGVGLHQFFIIYSSVAQVFEPCGDRQVRWSQDFVSASCR